MSLVRLHCVLQMAVDTQSIFSEYIKTQNGALSVIDQPLQSLDINITEAVLDHLDTKYSKRQSFEFPLRKQGNYS